MNTQLDATFAASLRDALGTNMRAATRYSTWRKRAFIGAGSILVLAFAGTAGAAASGKISTPWSEPETPATYGEPGYHSSTSEENDLRAVNKAANKAGALGIFRTGADSVTLRMPAGAPLAGLPTRIGRFSVTAAHSQFESASALRLTVSRVKQVLKSDTEEDASGSFSYLPESDSVEAAGSWSTETIARLNKLFGVTAVQGAGMGDLTGTRPPTPSPQP